MTRHEATHRDVVCLADVKPDPLRWLWQGRIPIGKLTLLDGNPGDGKTTITADIAARLSNGAEMPDGTRAIDAPAATLFMSAEDGLGDTLRPRLVASGARLDLIHALPHVTGRDGTRKLPRLPDDVDRIADAIRHKDVKLIVIDPLMAFFSAQTDSHRDQHARAALQPLAHLAEEFGAAIMLVRHPTKSSKSRMPIHCGGGSIGIIGAARAGFIVGRDPDDPARRVFAATKSNLATLPLSLSYSIESAEGAGRIVWHGPCQHDALAVLAAPADGDRSAMALARAFLQGLMVSAGGCIAAKEAKARGEAEGIAERTLERARLALGYVSERSGFGPGGGNLWRSPMDDHREHVRVPPPEQPILASALDHDVGEHGDDGEHGQQSSEVSSVRMLANTNGGEHVDAPATAPDGKVVWRTGPGGAAVRFHHHGDDDWVAVTDVLKAHESTVTVRPRTS